MSLASWAAIGTPWTVPAESPSDHRQRLAMLDPGTDLLAFTRGQRFCWHAGTPHWSASCVGSRHHARHHALTGGDPHLTVWPSPLELAPATMSGPTAALRSSARGHDRDLDPEEAGHADHSHGRQADQKLTHARSIDFHRGTFELGDLGPRQACMAPVSRPGPTPPTSPHPQTQRAGKAEFTHR